MFKEILKYVIFTESKAESKAESDSFMWVNNEIRIIDMQVFLKLVSTRNITSLTSKLRYYGFEINYENNKIIFKHKYLKKNCPKLYDEIKGKAELKNTKRRKTITGSTLEATYLRDIELGDVDFAGIENNMTEEDLRYLIEIFD